MKVICAWHPKYFGEELEIQSDLTVLGKVSHGICPRCKDLIAADIPWPVPRCLECNDEGEVLCSGCNGGGIGRDGGDCRECSSGTEPCRSCGGGVPACYGPLP